MRATNSLRIALALVFASALACAPAPAFASNPAASAALQANKRAQVAAQAEILRMNMQLQTQIASYNAITARLQKSQQDISEVTSEIAQADVHLDAVRSQLSTRAVQLYRGEQTTLLDVLLGTKSLQNLMGWADYLVRINNYDSQLLAQVQLQRNQDDYLRQTLAARQQQLQQELDAADAQRTSILALIDSEQIRIKALGGAAARLLAATTAPTGSDAADRNTFGWNTLITEANFRASDSMSAADVQTWLNKWGGPLKSYSAPDHKGRTRTAAQIIAEAAVGNRVSPRVIIATLQKEQSLIEKQPSSSDAYAWAMGMGKTDSATFTQYKGFGKQVWFGANHLAHDGDGWHKGISLPIDGLRVYPTNPGTLSLYRYTPHQHGAMSFYTIYSRYFGNPYL